MYNINVAWVSINLDLNETPVRSRLSDTCNHGFASYQCSISSASVIVKHAEHYNYSFRIPHYFAFREFN